jgi:hypothetical protein
VAGPGFVQLANLTGISNSVPSLQLAVYPGPFDLHTDAVLAQNSEKELVPQIVKGLTGKIEPAAEGAKKKGSEAVVFSGTLEEVNKYFTDNGWSDGAAIVPPTAERVATFLKYTDYAPDEEIAVLASANLRATPRNIAINAIMAGARPEHMPILIAMVQAVGDPRYKVSYSRRAGSTHSFQTYFWLNGPVARQLGVDFSQGLVASPVNHVLARAMSLIERNIAGYQIKLTQVGTFGKLASWVLAEDDESALRIGWKPYNVEKGLDVNANTVTTGESTVWGQNLIPSTSDAKTLMQLIAYDLTRKEQFAAGWNGSKRVLLMTPTTAQVLAEGGYTKESLKKDLAATARVITYEWAWSKVHGSYGAIYPPFEQELVKVLAEPRAEKGKLPPWYPRFPGWEEIQTTPSVTNPNDLEILVLGDPSRNKVQTMSANGYGHKQIRLPKNWDALMKTAGYRPLQEFHTSPEKAKGNAPPPAPVNTAANTTAQ